MPEEANPPVRVLPPHHTSFETAYQVDDYPYGYRLRCKIRYWIETKPGHGQRLVTCTTNPKKNGEVWNQPKTGTYSPIVIMYLDQEQHVQTKRLGRLAGAEQIRQFAQEYALTLNTDYHRKAIKQLLFSLGIYDKNTGKGTPDSNNPEPTSQKNLENEAGPTRPESNQNSESESSKTGDARREAPALPAKTITQPVELVGDAPAKTPSSKEVYNKIAAGNLSVDLEGYAFTKIKLADGTNRGILYYLSMFGREAEVKAIWAGLLSHPPSPVTLYRVEEDGFTEDTSVPRIQLWAADKSQGGGWHLAKKNVGKAYHYVLVPNIAFADPDYTRATQELGETPPANFLILMREEAPVVIEEVYYDRLNNPKNPLVSTPLKREWARWLWHRARHDYGEVKRIRAEGITAYLCLRPDEALLEQDLSRAIALGEDLTIVPVPEEEAREAA